MCGDLCCITCVGFYVYYTCDIEKLIEMYLGSRGLNVLARLTTGSSFLALLKFFSRDCVIGLTDVCECVSVLVC